MSLVKLTRAVQDRIRHLDLLVAQLEQTTTSAIHQLGDRPDVGFVACPIDKDGPAIAYLQGSSMPLKTSRSIDIPPLCTAALPHDISIETDGVVLLIPEPSVFLEHGLFVGVCVQPTGVVSTSVFNVTGHAVRVRKGEVVSRLVVL
jgi:hypothetical protein